MDITLFFVLPLIGGFAFVTGFLLLSYKTGRQEAQRLYYRAALYGVILAIGAAILHLTAHTVGSAYSRTVDRTANAVLVPLFEKDHSAASLPMSAAALSVRLDLAIICLYAFVLGALTPVWNLILRLTDRIWLMAAPPKWRRSFLGMLNLRAITDQLERLLAKSLSSGSLIQVTLSNSKVYVGTVLESLDPTSPAKYFKIQPWMSGHRAEDGTVEFTTFYDDVLAAFERDETKRAVVESFQLVIPIDKVLTASGFDVAAYERFLEGRAPGPDDRVAEPETPSTNSSAERVARVTLYASVWQAVAAALRLFR